MLLSKLKPETRSNYLTKEVEVKSPIFKGRGILESIRNQKKVVIKLIRSEKFRPQATQKLITHLIVSVDHVMI